MSDVIAVLIWCAVSVIVCAVISTSINRRARIMRWASEFVRDMQHARRGAGPSSQGVLRASDFPGTQSIGYGSRRFPGDAS